MDYYLQPLFGGALIGLAAGLYLLSTGRILGVSGMLGQVLNPDTALRTPALPFFAGLLAASFFGPKHAIDASTAQVVIAGLLVGFGTRLGSGCTSGHGVCGLSRWSPRSLVAVCTFMATGFATVFVQRHLF